MNTLSLWPYKPDVLHFKSCFSIYGKTGYTINADNYKAEATGTVVGRPPSHSATCHLFNNLACSKASKQTNVYKLNYGENCITQNVFRYEHQRRCTCWFTNAHAVEVGKINLFIPNQLINSKRAQRRNMNYKRISIYSSHNGMLFKNRLLYIRSILQDISSLPMAGFNISH